TGTYCRGKFSVDRNGDGIQTVDNGSFVDRTVNPYVLDFDGDGKDDYISFDTSNRKNYTYSPQELTTQSVKKH
ncbi:hypothetical protein VINI7043_21076, partial [Vibrio nigripulchritudo ATCC 27043]|uniref:hypothetical protein n=1 Tax=Vibrio nigripulchritudo TaxID=28173 RepID=UPI00021C2310